MLTPIRFEGLQVGFVYKFIKQEGTVFKRSHINPDEQGFRQRKVENNAPFLVLEIKDSYVLGLFPDGNWWMKRRMTYRGEIVLVWSPQPSTS